MPIHDRLPTGAQPRQLKSRTANSYQHGSDDEISLRELLYRYLCPFWLFQDASSGSMYARAAAYKHNRGMRIHLPTYLRRWMVSSGIALGLMCMFDTLTETVGHGSQVLVLMAAGAGILFACSVCLMFVMGYAYLYLSQKDY